MDFGKWLLDVMGRLDTTPAEDVDCLLPHLWKRDQEKTIEHRERPHQEQKEGPWASPMDAQGPSFFPTRKRKSSESAGAGSH